MNISTTSKLIKTNIQTYGEPCKITFKDGSVIDTYAVKRRIWKNDKTKLEPLATQIGMSKKDYLVAIFGFDIPVTDCGEDDIAFIGEDEYYFVRTDKIMAGSTVQYLSSVLRRVVREDENVFN